MQQPTLYTLTYRRPGAAHPVTLDCYRADGDRLAALRSARRWIARENRTLRRAGIGARIRTPQAHHLAAIPAGPAPQPQAEG